MMAESDGIVFLEELGGQLEDVARRAAAAATVPRAGRRRGVALRGRVSLSRRPVILIALAILAALAGIALSQDAVRAEIRELLGLVPARQAIMVTGVATDPGGSLWAIGQSEAGRTVVTHREGDEWQRLPDLDLRLGAGLVAPVSSDEVWAMVAADVGEGRIVHWDGETWTDVPYPGASGDELWDVTARAPDDVWLVGSREGRPYREVGDEPGQLTTGRRPFTWHWDGSEWSAVSPPPLGGRTGRLNVVSGAAGGVWAGGQVEHLVGTATPKWFGDGDLPMPVTRDEPVVLRWDGARWLRVPLPGRGAGGSGLAGLNVMSGGDVYVALNSQLTSDASPEQRYATCVSRWDGDGWRTVGGPRTGRLDGWTTRAMTVTTTGDVWLLADSQTGDLATWRWDGETWTRSDLEAPSETGGPVVGTGAWQLAVTGTDEVWLFGGRTSLAGGRQWVWRWSGERWEWIETRL